MPIDELAWDHILMAGWRCCGIRRLLSESFQCCGCLAYINIWRTADATTHTDVAAWSWVDWLLGLAAGSMVTG